MNDKVENLETSPPGKGGVDKMDLHYRQQLSALIDGALAPDEARFLLRRIQHDHELAGCWERWQVAGEIMRGRAVAVLPAGFAARVGTAIGADVPSSSARSPQRQAAPWARWGGGAALAASVAVVALLLARQAPDPEPAAPSKVAIVATTPAPVVQAPAPMPEAPSTQADAAGQALAAAASAGAMAAHAPRRAAQRTRVQAHRTAAAPDATRIEVASAQASHPFATGAPPVARPWPRAVLPQFGGSGVLTADTDSATSPSFYPFQPRLPDAPIPPDAAPAKPR
jgi:negative regulator of sigma E activity